MRELHWLIYTYLYKKIIHNKDNNFLFEVIHSPLLLLHAATRQFGISFIYNRICL